MMRNGGAGGGGGEEEGNGNEEEGEGEEGDENAPFLEFSDEFEPLLSDVERVWGASATPERVVGAVEGFMAEFVEGLLRGQLADIVLVRERKRERREKREEQLSLRLGRLRRGEPPPRWPLPTWYREGRRSSSSGREERERKREKKETAKKFQPDLFNFHPASFPLRIPFRPPRKTDAPGPVVIIRVVEGRC